LKDFVYVGNSVEKRAFSWKNLWKYNKQEVWMRTDIPLNEKAGFYQAFAALFGASLKKEYHPEDDDKMVERVVTLVENGQL
jgi:hypothetical protein